MERLHQSIAKILLSSCPAAARHKLDNPDEVTPTKAMDLGSLVDQLVFGGASFHTIAADDYRKKATQEARDAARARGQIPILEREIEPAMRLAGRIRSVLMQEGVELDKCMKQESMQWESSYQIFNPDGSNTRVLWQGTPDLALLRGNEWITIDLKVGGRIDPDYLDQHVADQYWDLQAVTYQDAGFQTFPKCERRGTHFLLGAETSGAQMVQIYPFSESMMELGRLKWARAQIIWNQCQRHDHWPEFERRALVPKPWAIEREQQR